MSTAFQDEVLNLKTKNECLKLWSSICK